MFCEGMEHRIARCVDAMGYDDFPLLERYLLGQDPIEPGDLDGWHAVPASARRRPGLE